MEQTAKTNPGRTIFLMAALVASMAIGLSDVGAAGQEPADVSGEWALQVDTDLAGRTTPGVTLMQDGATLTGHYSSDALGENDVTGTVNGNAIEFSFDAEAQGQSFLVTYTGTLQEDGTLAGDMDLGGLGGGPFTGTRR